MSRAFINVGPDARRLELAGDSDPRDAAELAVACLAAGGLVVLPTGAGAGLAASALRPEAVARLRRARGATDSARPVGQIVILDPEELADWVGKVPDPAARLADRGWPGDLTLLLPWAPGAGLAAALAAEAVAAVSSGPEIGFRCPGHPLPRRVQALSPGPLVLARAVVVEGGDTPAETLGAGDLLVAAAEPDPADARPTVLRVREDRPVELVRAGAVDEATWRGWLATTILFICTGNTCRSPMAEALMKVRLAERLGCPPDRLDEHGFVIRSAGLGAMAGMPAASNAMKVVEELGGSLAGHTSQKATQDLVRQADLILAMTSEHLDVLLHYFPGAEGKTFLVDPEGYDIDDPIGADLATYKRTVLELSAHLAYWAERLLTC